MAGLGGTKTLENLKAAFANEAQDNRRCLFFARQAAAEGYVGLAELFREVADANTSYAEGFYEHLKQAGDAVTGVGGLDSSQNLQVLTASREHASAVVYPQMAEMARQEGLVEVAKWFEYVAGLCSRDTRRLRLELQSMG